MIYTDKGHPTTVFWRRGRHEKAIITWTLVLAMLLSLALPAAASSAGSYPVFEGGVTEIQKYGNIVLDIDPAELQAAGYEYGDLMTVTVNSKDHSIPLPVY